MFHNLLAHTRNKLNDAVYYTLSLHKKNVPESVFFYTFHKCASSLFAGYILKNIRNLHHVDYASRIYLGTMKRKPVFHANGFIYGPLRLSLRHDSLEYGDLVEITSDPAFVHSRTTIFFIRDPRDILVSRYFSFGYNHSLSPVRETREIQATIKRNIQNMSIDQYCIAEAQILVDGFKKLQTLHENSRNSVILKYEDMIYNWDTFSEGLTKHLDINKRVLANIYSRTRPVEKENLSAHRRNGRAGSFRDKLQNNTKKHLNTTFTNVLKQYEYVE